ncbi:reverse transcriptase domain-containing protein, partial [Tanacetum coccineum]
MSIRSGPSPTAPTFVVRNTVGQGKEMSQGNLNGPASDAVLKEYCDKHYNHLLPILAEKMYQEKVQQEKLKAVKAHLNFEEVLQHSESGTPSRRRDLRKRLESRRICSMSGSPEPRCGRSESPRKRDPERKTVFKRLERVVFHMLGDKGKTISAYSSDSRRQSNIITKEHPHKGRKYYQKVKVVQEDTGSHDQKNKGQALRIIYPSHSYDDLKESFLEKIRQQKKCIKDPVEIHHIKQRGGESTKDFVRRFKVESRDVKGAPKIMRISGFMHGITNPELIKRLHDKIPKSVDEMMRITTSFIRGEVAAGNQERKKSLTPWKQQESGHKQNFKKGGFKNQQRPERRQDRFTLLSKSPKEILGLEKGKFKAPPPMTTPVEKRNNIKFCKFHGEVGHNTDECMHLKRQIEELLKAGKLSYVIKELKQNNGKDQPKINKKEEASNKDKALAILMIQPWQRVARQRITQSFSPDPKISFSALGEEEGTEGPMIIEAEIRGHFIHRMYVDGGSALKILYEHCFNRLRPKIKNQMVPATTPLIGFSGEIIWPLQISLLVKIGDEEHSTSAWMNFVIVRSSSPYNGIIGRPRVRKIQVVPSTAHGMLKFPVARGILTLKSNRIIPIACAAVLGPARQPPAAHQAIEERIKVAINPDYPKQTIMIGSTLTEEGRNKLCDLLQRSLDVFAWKPADMTGVPRHIAEH